MPGKRVHVVPSGDDWLVEEDGQQLMVSHSRQQAEKCAHHEAKRIKGEVVIHNHEGRVEQKFRPE